MTTFAKSPGGEFRKADLSSPLVIKTGDLVQQVGNQIVIIRNGQVVSTANISATTTVQPLAASHPDVINHVVFFRSKPVSGQSVSNTDVKELTDGSVAFSFNNSNQRVFATWEEMGQNLGAMDQDPTLAENAIMLRAYRNSPDGANKTTMIGINCAINFNAVTPFAFVGENI